MDDSSGETIARYQQVFEECQEAIAILTLESQVLDVNRAWLDLFGYQRKEIVGTDAGRALGAAEEDLHRLQGQMELCSSVKDYSMRLSLKNGRQLDCKVTITALRDENGLHGYIYVVRDATAQKKTERSLRSLLHLSDRLNSASDLDGVLDRLVEELLELLGAESGCAGLRTTQGMSCGHFFRGPGVVPLTYHCVPGVGWAGWLIEYRTHYLTNDAAHDPVILPEVRERLAIKSGIAIPIVDSEKDVIAFFEVYNKEGDAGFTQADLDHSLAAAHIASFAIHNRLLHRNLSALAAFSQSLTTASDFDEILEVVGRHIELNFKRRSVIFLPSNGELVPRFRNSDFVFGESELAAAAWAWEHGQEAPGAQPKFCPPRQALYLPLKARGEVIGVLRPRSEVWSLVLQCPAPAFRSFH